MSETEMSNAARKAPYHHGDLPQTLMALALGHIASDGTERLSLRALAREAGVSATAPYRHFPSKRCLLAALGIQGFRGMSAALNEASATAVEPKARLLAMGVAYVRWARANPTAYQLMFGSVIGDFSDYTELEAASTEAFAQLLMLLAEIVTEQSLDIEVAELAAVVWAGVHGIASLTIDREAKGGGKGIPAVQAMAFLDDNVERAIAMMLAGLFESV